MQDLAKDTVARDLIAWHFRTEPELQRVFILRSNIDSSPDAPIRLLAVNAATPATGSIEPFGFAPTVEVPFRTVIAEITPEEYEQLRSDPASLKHPPGWELSSAEEVTRPSSP
jgi:hypothetical protein